MLVAFTYRDFRVQWIGACTSSIGTWMQIAAQNWLIVSLTNASPLYLGLDAFLQQLPIILFSLIGGVFADRMRSAAHADRLAIRADGHVGHARAARILAHGSDLARPDPIVRHRLRAGVRRSRRISR